MLNIRPSLLQAGDVLLSVLEFHYKVIKEKAILRKI